VDVPLIRSRRQNHVGDDCYAHASPMGIGKIHLADTNCRANAQKSRPREQPSFCDRTKVIDLQLDRREAALAVKVPVERAAYRRIRDTRRDAAVQRARAVQQLRTDSALDGDAVAMHAYQLESQQVVERMPGEQFADMLSLSFEVAQVW